MSVVANVAINLDARGVSTQLAAIRQTSIGAANGFKNLEARAQAVKSIVEAQQGSFAKASTVQGVFAAKVKNTEFAIKSQIAALRDVQSKVQLNGALYKKAAEQIAQYEAVLKSANNEEQKGAGSGASALAASLGRLAAAYFTLQTAQQAVQAGIQREESTRRLTFLAQGYNEIAQAQEAAARAGRQFGLSTTESNQQFAQLYGRLRPLNVSLEDIESAFIGFNTAAKVSGTSTAETAAALLQLTQALGSGVLRGQELNSVLEQAPGLVVALTKELGMPVKEIRKLAEEGKITSDVVIRALKRAGSDGADELAEAMNGPAQQVKNLQNAFEDLQVTISRVFSPAVKAAIDGITTRAIDLNSGVERTALAFQFAANKLAPLLNGLEQLRWYFVNLTPPGWAMQVIGGSSNLAGNLIRGAAVAQKLETNATLAGGRYLEPGQQVNFMPRRPQPAAPPPMGGSAGSGRSRGGESAAEKAAREAERAAEAAAKEAARVKDVIRDRLAEGQLISVKSELQDRIAAAEAASDKMLVARLQSQERELEIQYRYAQELTKEADLNAQKAIIYEGLNALTANQIALQRELDTLQDQNDQDRLTALQKYIEKQYELNSSVQNQLQLADGVANTLGEGLGSAFNALIAGAQGWEKSLQQIASGVLVDIANQLIRIFVVEQAINAIKTFLTPFSSSTPLGAGGGTVGKFGTLGPNYGIPQRANGGSVAGGSPYIVGERGPELFVPGRSGTIVPNDKMGGGGVSVVVNVDASGSNVEGDAEDSKQLGRVIAAAIQQELVKQKRPGGLLA